MPRPPKPWYYKERDSWFVVVDGKRHRLAKGEANKSAAMDAFHHLMLVKPGAAPADPKFRDVALAFLSHSQNEVKAGTMSADTYEQYRIKIFQANKSFGNVKARLVKPSHITQWFAQHMWAQATRRGALTAVKRALQFGVTEGMLAFHPIADMKRPKMTRRMKTLTPSERTIIASGCWDQAIADLVLAMQETGARSTELFRLKADDIDWAAGVAILKGKTTASTGRNRVLVLSPNMIMLCKRLAAEYPKGPLLRNRDGNQWTRNAVRCRFRRMRERLGLPDGVSPVAFRHSFVTDGLEDGVSIAAMAELAGHTDTKMITEQYSHLSERTAHLRQQVVRTVRAGRERQADQG